MIAVIFAGGLGSRISEETINRPKPMIEIGGFPILWHILKIYSSYGINNFIICCGYKGYMIKEYFSNYFLHMSDITFNMEDNRMLIHRKKAEPWKVTLVDTGSDTFTGGRLKRVADYLVNEDIFCLTYGDGLSNVDINKLISFHREKKVKATLTAVIPPARFGALDIKDSMVKKFREKPIGDGGKINGGYFVLSSKVIDYISDDTTIWEREPLERLAQEGELAAYDHTGFWHPMDTLRDKNYLEELWQSGKAPWKVWT
jgi:glucose-1-phosphate cytidylyltransferase